MSYSTPTLKMVTLDCADPRRLAEFWSALLDWKPAHAEDDYAMVTGPDGTAIGMGRVPDYQPPEWPNPRGAKQFHFDLAAQDIPAVEARCVELGATVPDDQPGGDRWRVLLDPAGHPFCLTDAAMW